MENEKIYSVLTEILEEQKENTKLLLELKALLKHIDEKSKKSQTDNIDTSCNQMLQDLSNEVKQVKVFLAGMPRYIRQEKRFLFFPEQNAKEYYSVVLRWLLYIIMTTYGYWLLKIFINSHLSHD